MQRSVWSVLLVGALMLGSVGAALAHHGWRWTTGGNIEVTGIITAAQLVVPVACTALGCAVISGGLLFIGRAAQYVAFDLFQLKIEMISIALAMTLTVDKRYGLCLEKATARQRVRIGTASICLWCAVAVAGRMIAFVHGGSAPKYMRDRVTSARRT